MKCTRKTEDKMRKVVGWCLALIGIAVVIFLGSVVPGFLVLLCTLSAIIAFLMGLMAVILWLDGSISFCSDDE